MRNALPASPAPSPENENRNVEASPFCAAPRHPVGLLYTMLRHGRGLSHEEAHRISFESIHGQPQGHADKAA